MLELVTCSPRRRSRTGRRPARAITRFVDATPGEPDGVNGVYDLVLKPNGAIAWMVGRGGYFPGSPYYHQLWALDAGGLRLLDTGADLALRSLELHDSTLTWTNAGSARTASLN